jgi:hypothetical protein
LAENAINTLQPQLANPAGGEFHPTGSWSTSATTFPIPDFSWGIAGVPAGNNSNAVPVDYAGVSRTATNPPGAYFTSITLITAPIFRSGGSQDGLVLESGESSSKGGTVNATAGTFNLGDDAADRQYRAFLHFDTSSLPDTAVITRATLKIMRQSIAGTNPFTTHTALRADIRRPYFGASAVLQAADFQAAASAAAAGTFGVTPAGAWYSAVLTSTGRNLVNRIGTTQFRLYFTRDDNDDNGADYVKVYSGNAGAANRPQLIVQYYVP